MTYIPNPSRYDQMIYRPAGNSGLLTTSPLTWFMA